MPQDLTPAGGCCSSPAGGEDPHWLHFYYKAGRTALKAQTLLLVHRGQQSLVKAQCGNTPAYTANRCHVSRQRQRVGEFLPPEFKYKWLSCSLHIFQSALPGGILGCPGSAESVQFKNPFCGLIRSLCWVPGMTGVLV